jgi:hypothetical protein
VPKKEAKPGASETEVRSGAGYRNRLEHPTQPDPRRSLQVSMKGRLTNGATAGDLFLPETHAEPQM